MATKVLLDANVIIRFLTRDHEEHYLKSVEVFKSIESGETEALLMDFILAEVVYVLKKIYKHEKEDISSALKKLLLYKHLYTDNKIVTFEALDIYVKKNIDFADAMLCAKKSLEGFSIVSFDKDVERC
ncbi:MAG TPA: type II toxin-antitoxin system VapC family toxin [Arcobacter sp.]|nr:type II toxin-antitoxin system VapC family toxin [Arcobacter sp.]